MSCQKAEAFVFDIEIEFSVSPEEKASSDSTLRIAIIGDSISSFSGSSPSDIEGYVGDRYATYYPRGDVKSIECMWWYKVARALDVSLDDICNCSWSGSRVSGNSMSTTSAFAGCSTKRIMDLSAKGFDPDVVFCYISCNDWAGNVPLGKWNHTDRIPAEGNVSTLREAYALMISKIKSRFPSCVIVCLTNLDDKKRDSSPGSPSNNGNGVTVEDWNRNITELSDSFGCITVDLQECGINYDNVTKYTVDSGLHPNDEGMTLIANKVIEKLASITDDIPD